MSVFFFITQNHRPRRINVGDVDDDDADIDANSVDAEAGMKTVTFKMEHCDCMRLVLQANAEIEINQNRFPVLQRKDFDHFELIGNNVKFAKKMPQN